MKDDRLCSDGDFVNIIRWRDKLISQPNRSRECKSLRVDDDNNINININSCMVFTMAVLFYLLYFISIFLSLFLNTVITVKAKQKTITNTELVEAEFFGGHLAVAPSTLDVSHPSSCSASHPVRVTFS